MLTEFGLKCIRLRISPHLRDASLLLKIMLQLRNFSLFTIQVQQDKKLQKRTTKEHSRLKKPSTTAKERIETNLNEVQHVEQKLYNNSSRFG
jgi:uncharacterized protein YlxW (UPF0749 family)